MTPTESKCFFSSIELNTVLQSGCGQVSVTRFDIGIFGIVTPIKQIHRAAGNPFRPYPIYYNPLGN